MGKVKENMINGLPYKCWKSSVEIKGLVGNKLFKKLYKRVAYRLPVYQKQSSKGKEKKT